MRNNSFFNAILRMRTNHQAIDGAVPWRQSQDSRETVYTSEDFRFTAANGAIYAIALAASEDGSYTVRSLSDSADPNRPNFHGDLKSVEVLGYSAGECQIWRVNFLPFLW